MLWIVLVVLYLSPNAFAGQMESVIKGNVGALYGRFRLETGHPVTDGHIFAIDEKGNVIAHSTTQGGVGPDSGRWQLLSLPADQKITVIGFLTKLMPAIAVEVVKIKPGYHEFNRLTLVIRSKEVELNSSLGASQLGWWVLITKFFGHHVKTLDDKRGRDLANHLLSLASSLGDDRLGRQPKEKEIFFDNFNDSVIDLTLWRSNGKTGGLVTEHDGVMDVRVYNGNDIQYLTIPNLFVDADRLTLELRVQVRRIAPDKNNGFWFGDEDGNVGFDCVFSQKWQRFTTPIGAVGSQFGTPPISVGGGSSAQWHLVKVVKEGTTYTITINNLFVGSSDAIQPRNLHFSGGHRWMSNYGYEGGELHFDYVKVTAEIF